MKSDAEILKEYVEKDDFYNSLSTQEKLLYIVTIRDTTDFELYLLKARLKELFELIIESVKKIVR